VRAVDLGGWQRGEWACVIRETWCFLEISLVQCWRPAAAAAGNDAGDDG